MPSRTREQGAGGLEPRLGLGGGVDQRGEGPGTAEGGAAGGGAGDVAVEPERLGVDQAAIAADAPVVGERARGHRLAHGGAAEHQGLERGQAGVGGQVDLEAAGEPGAVEQDRLLRQPVEAGAGAEAEAGLDPGGGAGRAVVALGGLGGGDQCAPAPAAA